MDAAPYLDRLTTMEAIAAISLSVVAGAALYLRPVRVRKILIAVLTCAIPANLITATGLSSIVIFGTRFLNGIAAGIVL